MASLVVDIYNSKPSLSCSGLEKNVLRRLLDILKVCCMAMILNRIQTRARDWAGQSRVFMLCCHFHAVDDHFNSASLPPKIELTSDGTMHALLKYVADVLGRVDRFIESVQTPEYMATII